MKTRNIFTRLSIAVALVALLATTSIWHAQRVRAAEPNTDPPTFGIVNIVSGQAVRLNVVCSHHGVNGLPPDPCRGALGFHNALGNDVQVATYALQPGESMFLEQGFSPITNEAGRVGYTPCIIPAPNNRGRAIPSVEVFNTTSGKTEFYINAIPRLSSIQDGVNGAPTTTGQ